jgi:protein phosphatase PTC1
MRKAYLGARAKIRETQRADETSRAGSVSVLVINTEKLVTASMGNYRAVVCRNGVAREIGKRDQKSAKRYWSRRLFSGMEEHFNSCSVCVSLYKLHFINE